MSLRRPDAPLLAADGVSHDFGAGPVLEGVEIELRAGELVCVVGPNGAGKTTLARVLSGVLSPRFGRATFEGRALAELSRREVARAVAVVPQSLEVPFPYSVREMVEMGRAPRLGPLGRTGERDRRIVARELCRLGLTALAHRRFPTLSGGERQRVLLARAFAQETPALLLDEPTAHMDLGHRLFAFESLRAWVEASQPVRGALVVSHDLQLAARFADRIVVLDHGRVDVQGSPAHALSVERIERIWGVQVRIDLDAAGRLLVVALRSRIRYAAGPDEPD